MSEIARLRQLAGWSQFRLSQETGIDRTRISLLENQHVIPKAEEQQGIESALLAEIARRAELFSKVGKEHVVREVKV